jgi:hypothetical protein
MGRYAFTSGLKARLVDWLRIHSRKAPRCCWLVRNPDVGNAPGKNTAPTTYLRCAVTLDIVIETKTRRPQHLRFLQLIGIEFDTPLKSESGRLFVSGNMGVNRGNVSPNAQGYA